MGPITREVLVARQGRFMYLLLTCLPTLLQSMLNMHKNGETARNAGREETCEVQHAQILVS